MRSTRGPAILADATLAVPVVATLLVPNINTIRPGGQLSGWALPYYVLLLVVAVGLPLLAAIKLWRSSKPTSYAPGCGCWPARLRC